jgi:TolB protein
MTQKLPYFDGISSAPSWHPDGKSIALTLSKKGNKDIYSYHLKDKKLTRLTFDNGIDTEANYSPDGDSIVFTSNRSGQVQVYIKNLISGKIKRATFSGAYNAKAVFSPDGKQLAMVHRVDKDYRIALLDIKTKDLIVMTNNTLDESPYFSPNGNMIIFATNKKDRGVLSVVSLLGRETFELASKAGEVREPNWSHYSR